MLKEVAVGVGIAGIVVAVFAIIILILLKKNITDILNKDAILFSKNFELKKEAINNSLNLVDEVAAKGKTICLNPEFAIKAKDCYNNLLCVVTNVNHDKLIVTIKHPNGWTYDCAVDCTENIEEGEKIKVTFYELTDWEKNYLPKIK